MFWTYGIFIIEFLLFRQLTDLRSQEALEKEKIRRDYERLRLELDELSKQEQEAKSRSNVSKLSCFLLIKMSVNIISFTDA